MLSEILLVVRPARSRAGSRTRAPPSNLVLISSAALATSSSLRLLTTHLDAAAVPPARRGSPPSLPSAVVGMAQPTDKADADAPPTVALIMVGEGWRWSNNSLSPYMYKKVPKVGTVTGCSDVVLLCFSFASKSQRTNDWCLAQHENR
jgi:hypothetical protein